MELVHRVHQTDTSASAPRPSSPASGRATPNGGTTPDGGETCDSRDVFHVSFDPDDESVVEVVTDAVAVIHNVEPDELDPLHEAVDVDALEALVAPDADRPGADEVQFVYEGLAVVVDGEGDVWLRWD